MPSETRMPVAVAPTASTDVGDAALTAERSGTAQARRVRPRRAKRADIEGLRAVAVSMVLLFHAGVPVVAGGFAGVDVFFVISGFLITGLIVREVEATGRLSLTVFWSRRAKRLLPATALVLVFVAVTSHLVLSPLRWARTGGDVVSAAAYVINWRLAEQSLDYLAAGYAASPVQHFWSLAVEEQFYLVWPLLVMLIVALGARRRWPVRRALAAGLILVAVPSFAWSVYLTAREPTAYFVTTTRAWELAIGAAVALAARRLERLPAGVATAATWLGLAGLAASALLLSNATPWPGSAALLPTVATALVIGGGPAARRGAGTLLSTAPMQAVGAISYSLYLWHWPLIVFATAHWGELSTARGLAVVLVSAVPAYLSYRFLERPLHHSRSLTAAPRKALLLGLVCTLLGVVAGFGLAKAPLPIHGAAPPQLRPGAIVLQEDPANGTAVDKVPSITPDPLVAREDLPALYGRGCQSNYTAGDARPCVFGDTTSSQVIYLIGDSKAAQWMPTVDAVAKQHGWKLISVTKAGCPFADVDIVKGPRGKATAYTSCTEWNQNVEHLLMHGQEKPKFVVVTDFSPYAAAENGHELDKADSKAAIVQGLRTTWARVTAAGIPVITLRETPSMGHDVAECVAENVEKLTRCATARKAAFGPAHTIEAAAKGQPDVGFLDLNAEGICPQDPCAAVIGNVLVYRDDHHLTALYATTLAPLLDAKLTKLFRGDFAEGKLADLVAEN